MWKRQKLQTTHPLGPAIGDDTVTLLCVVLGGFMDATLMLTAEELGESPSLRGKDVMADIGAMDIAQRLELQTLSSIGYRVHIYYEPSTTQEINAKFGAPVKTNVQKG